MLLMLNYKFNNNCWFCNRCTKTLRNTIETPRATQPGSSVTGQRKMPCGCGVSALPGAHALPVPLSFQPPYGEQARRAGQWLTRFGAAGARRASHKRTKNGQNTDGGTRGGTLGGRRGGARLCGRVVPKAPQRLSRVVRGEACVALRARGARASIARGRSCF